MTTPHEQDLVYGSTSLHWTIKDWFNIGTINSAVHFFQQVALSFDLCTSKFTPKYFLELKEADSLKYSPGIVMTGLKS